MTTTPSTEIMLRVPSNHLMADLLGERDHYLRIVERAFPTVRIVARGNELDLAGEGADVARTVLEELLVLVQEGQVLDDDRVTRVVDLVKEEVPSPSGIFTANTKVEQMNATWLR